MIVGGIDNSFEIEEGPQIFPDVSSSSPGYGPGTQIRCSRRTMRQPVHFTEDFGLDSWWKDLEVVALAYQLWGTKTDILSDFNVDKFRSLLADNNINAAFQHPKVFAECTFAASNNKDEDSPTYMEALTGPYEEEFREAMVEKIKSMVKQKT